MAEPITLTDADGSVTRVAPWSTWTREQVRAPGGEPSLVTRLDQGQLWFAAGRRRSPWRHEVQVGPATVSTPRGRFHVTAEADGGATIACLAGRTRVVAGLREPVVLGPDQTAAVSSDGATLVVMDRSSTDEPVVDGPASSEPIALPDAWPADELAEIDAAGREDERPDEAEEPAVAADGPDAPVDQEEGTEEPTAAAASSDVPAEGAVAAAAADPDAAEATQASELVVARPGAGPDGPHRRRWTRIPEVIAIAALLAVLVAAVIVFGGGSDDAVVADAPRTTDPVATSTTARPSTTASTSTTAAPTTEGPSTTVATTTTPPALVAPGTAQGALDSCRRAPGGVLATVTVTHASGGPGRFVARVGLVDGAGQVFATGEGRTGTLEPGASAPVEVLVAVAGDVSGACELLGVISA